MFDERGDRNDIDWGGDFVRMLQRKNVPALKRIAEKRLVIGGFIDFDDSAEAKYKADAMRMGLSGLPTYIDKTLAYRPNEGITFYNQVVDEGLKLLEEPDIYKLRENINHPDQGLNIASVVTAQVTERLGREDLLSYADRIYKLVKEDKNQWGEQILNGRASHMLGVMCLWSRALEVDVTGVVESRTKELLALCADDKRQNCRGDVIFYGSFAGSRMDNGLVEALGAYGSKRKIYADGFSGVSRDVLCNITIRSYESNSDDIFYWNSDNVKNQFSELGSSDLFIDLLRKYPDKYLKTLDLAYRALVWAPDEDRERFIREFRNLPVGNYGNSYFYEGGAWMFARGREKEMWQMNEIIIPEMFASLRTNMVNRDFSVVGEWLGYVQNGARFMGEQTNGSGDVVSALYLDDMLRSVERNSGGNHSAELVVKLKQNFDDGAWSEVCYLLHRFIHDGKNDQARSLLMSLKNYDQKTGEPYDLMRLLRGVGSVDQLEMIRKGLADPDNRNIFDLICANELGSGVLLKDRVGVSLKKAIDLEETNFSRSENNYPEQDKKERIKEKREIVKTKEQIENVLEQDANDLEGVVDVLMDYKGKHRALILPAVYGVRNDYLRSGVGSGFDVQKFRLGMKLGRMTGEVSEELMKEWVNVDGAVGIEDLKLRTRNELRGAYKELEFRKVGIKWGMTDTEALDWEKGLQSRSLVDVLYRQLV